MTKNTEHTPDKFLTPDEVCHILGLGHNTVYMLLKKGIIKNYRFQNRRKIRLSDLEAYIQSQVQGASETSNDDAGNH